MATTTEQVRQQVGEELGLVPVGQTLESQDQSRIDNTYAQAYAYLKEKGIVGWAAAGDIPDKYIPYLTLLMESMLLIAYSVPEARFNRITLAAGPNGDNAVAKIAMLTVQEYSSNDQDCGF